MLGVALALHPRWQRTCRPLPAEAIIVVRLATPAALALLLSLPRFPLRSNIWHAGSRERWQGTVVVLAQCNYQGRSNYSFKGNADACDFQANFRARRPLNSGVRPLISLRSFVTDQVIRNASSLHSLASGQNATREGHRPCCQCAFGADLGILVTLSYFYRIISQGLGRCMGLA